MPRLKTTETMRFDLPDDPDCGWVEVRHLEDGDLQEVASLAYKTVTRFRDGRPESETVHDPIVERDELVRRSVVGWGNFFDAGGKPMPCTDGTKRLWGRDPDFCRFLADCRQKLAEQVRERREQARGN